jgi:hypothetical protein
MVPGPYRDDLGDGSDAVAMLHYRAPFNELLTLGEACH